MSKVIVSGSINMDVVAKAERHPAPGETIAGKDLVFIPGGKGANQAVAAAKLGADTLLIGNVGDDAFGAELYAFLKGIGVDLQYVKQVKKTPTGTAIIVVSDSAENTIVVVPGANASLAPNDVTSVPLTKGDILVSQFEIPMETIEAFFKAGRLRGTTNILNPAPAKLVSSELLNLSDIIVLNETELQLLTGEDVSLENAFERARKLKAFPEQIIIATLGKDGVAAVAGDRNIRVLGLKVKAVDTTGAGDCFVGALACKLACGSTLDKAITFANKAAAISVQRFGAGPSMPTVTDIEELALSA
jgi:ribokinase